MNDCTDVAGARTTLPGGHSIRSTLQAQNKWADADKVLVLDGASRDCETLVEVATGRSIVRVTEVSLDRIRVGRA